MPQKDDDQPVATAKLTNPITLRLGELESHVAPRMGGHAASATVKRDLGRYYALLGDGLRQIHLTLPEAEAVVFALQGFDAASIRYLWAEVERQYLANDDEPDHPPFYSLPDDLDAADLVEKLRQLTLNQSLALLDAVERYWSVDGAAEDWMNVDVERLIEVGLVFKGRADNDDKKRKAERGKMIVRDPAARLRRKRADEE